MCLHSKAVVRRDRTNEVSPATSPVFLLIMSSTPAGVMRYVVITVGAVALIEQVLAQKVSHVQFDPACGNHQETAGSYA